MQRAEVGVLIYNKIMHLAIVHVNMYLQRLLHIRKIKRSSI